MHKQFQRNIKNFNKFINIACSFHHPLYSQVATTSYHNHHRNLHILYIYNTSTYMKPNFISNHSNLSIAYKRTITYFRMFVRFYHHRMHTNLWFIPLAMELANVLIQKYPPSIHLLQLYVLLLTVFLSFFFLEKKI